LFVQILIIFYFSWQIPEKTTKIFRETHPKAEDFLHVDIRTDGQTDWHDDDNNTFPKFLIEFNETIISLRDFRKFTKHSSIFFLIRRDRQIEGWKLWNKLHNFGTPFQMRRTSTEDQRNFWPSYRQWSRYHITVCQVNTATQVVNWQTQIFWFRKARFYIPR
jgi:hypothetical protein